MVIIPLQAIPAQRLQVVLDGQNATVAFYWRWGRVYCDLSIDADKVCTGQVCLNKQPFPPYPSLYSSGKLMFLDMLGNEPPSWEGLGERWLLLYLSDGETLESALAGAVANA